MDEYLNDFIEEVNELADSLEKSLFELDKNREDKDLITQIFRAMHTLKGSSGMFGFEIITEFTHNLENIYELIRDKQIEITDNLLNITFKSVDHIKALLEDKELKIEQNKDSHTNLLKQIDAEAAKLGINDKNDQAEDKQEATIEIEKHLKTWHLRFKTLNDLNILFLFGEIQELEKCTVIPRFEEIPELNLFDPKTCYIYWDIIIATSKEEKEIREIFIFVENPTIELYLLSDIDLYTIDRFRNKLEESKRTKNELCYENIDEVKNIPAFETKEIESENKSQKEDIPTLNDAEEITEQFITPKLNAESENKQKTANVGEVIEQSGKTVISNIRVASSKIDDLMNLVSELITTQAQLNLVSEQNKIPALSSVTRNFQKLTRELRDKAFNLSLLPIDSMLTRFKRLVHDLSQKFDKPIIFKTEGTETELDKTLLQNLSDPIMHIIRNSIDHGIEDEETRIKAGKPKEGLITLKAFYSGACIYIGIKDDGAGIDPNKVKKKAISKKLIDPTKNYTEKEMLNMIFLPSLSTARKLTDISGRGVGMDVVKRKIEEVRGEVELATEIGKGTTVTIKLPLTLSIIDGLLVNIGDIKYIIQLTVVEKIYRVKKNQLNEYNSMIVLEGTQVPFHYLRKEFEVQEPVPDEMKIVVVSYESKKVGLVVDEVIGEYQAVLKPLGKLYEHVDMISGGSILGDGTVALVFDTSKVIKYFSNEI